MSAPVVLLHGWGGSFEATFERTGWRDALARAGRQVIALDLPGHGRAPASHDPVAYGDLAAELETRLPEGALDGIGFSLGGKLLLELALRPPRRFRRLVIGGVGNNVFAPERSGEAVAAALERGLSADAPAGVAALVRYSRDSGSDPLALAAVLRRPPNPVITTERLRDLSADVTLVNGTLDLLAAPDAALVAALPAARIVRLPGVDHVSLPSSAEFMRVAIG